MQFEFQNRTINFVFKLIMKESELALATESKMSPQHLQFFNPWKIINELFHSGIRSVFIERGTTSQRGRGIVPE
jgi:hypothetical protein